METGKEKTKKFTCPKCGTSHIVNSNLDIKHSYYTEDEETDKQVVKDQGVETGTEEDRKSDSRKSESQRDQEESKKTEFEKEAGSDESEKTFKEDSDPDEWDWGNW